MTKTKVLIIDDSALARQVLTAVLSSAHDIEVVGTASDPIIARDKIKKLKPNVLTLDVEMPNMNGIAFLSRLMKLKPMPVVMISSFTSTQSAVTLRALELGAVDYFLKPQGGVENIHDYADTIIDKVRLASSANLSLMQKKSTELVFDDTSDDYEYFSPGRIIAIGASTGGAKAIIDLLSSLPENFPPVVITQHIGKNLAKQFAERLDSLVSAHVQVPINGQPIVRGNVYIAPDSVHMVIVKNSAGGYICQIRKIAPVNGFRPSVEVLFDSVRKASGKEGIGILLTGMGFDGSKALLRMKEQGIHTICQDRDTSIVWGMARTAIELGAVDKILPIKNIGNHLIKQIQKFQRVDLKAR